MEYFATVVIKNFNPRPHVGSDRDKLQTLDRCNAFHSPPPRRERQTYHRQTKVITLFQSTPPRRERHQKHIISYFIFQKYYAQCTKQCCYSAYIEYFSLITSSSVPKNCANIITHQWVLTIRTSTDQRS